MAPVVLLLIATVPELGTILLEQALLDNATASASRLIKISPSTTTQSIFVNALCTDQGLNSMIATSTCTTGLQVRVQSAATFGAISNTLTTDSNGNITNTGYNAGGSASRVLVQVGFSRAFVTPWLGQFMGKNGHLLLISTVVFQNET